MAPAKSINLFAIVSLALFYISLAPIAANAVSVERAHVARHLNHAHAGIAKKKRDNPAKRCKPRPSSSTPPPSSSTPPPNTPAAAPPTTTYSSPANTPSTSPSPATTSSSYLPTTTSNSQGKVGISWSNGEETSLCNFRSPNTYLMYNWKSGGYPGIIDPTSCGFQYIPMCWGPGNFPDCINDIHNNAPGPVFFLNEPDQLGQSNTDVDTAVGLWFQYFQPLGSMGYQLISPACTNSDNGFAWIQSFVSKVEQQGGWMSGVATHIYSTDLTYAKGFLQKFINTFPKYGIWLTEYSAQDYSGNNQQLDENGVMAYMTGVSNFCFETPQIVASFAFTYMTASELEANNVNGFNAAIGDDDKPTALGQALLNPS